MTKPVTNIAASKRAKLSSLARTQGRSAELIFLLYMEERLLYRISRSNLSDKFVLKGGLLLYSLFGQTARPTRDIDLLGIDLPVQPEELAALFSPVCRMDFPDGVQFDAETVQAEVIREGAHYQGVRLSVVARLGQVQNTVQLDVGFHDAVTPAPHQMEYPVLLDDPAPVLPVYTLESVIAEKFEAMISLGQINGRMKDFYDVYQLARHADYSGPVLQEAVTRTLQRRRTVCPIQPDIFSTEFAVDLGRLRMWTAFLRNSAADPVEFAEVMRLLQVFLGPIYAARTSGSPVTGTWNRQTLTWS